MTCAGNIGLGYASCEELLKHKAHVYLAARTPSKAEDAIAALKKTVPDAQITFLELDLTSFDSIKKAADTFNSSSPRLDILLNNAGIMAVPEGLTKEGYEIQFGTNHMGHALLTKLLLPTLLKTQETHAEARIVNVSSQGHNMPPKTGLVFDEMKTDMQSTSTWVRYGQAKLANILFTKGLVEHYPQIKSIVIHPGAVNTNLSMGFREAHPWVSAALAPVLLRMLKTPASGALTQLFAATSPEAKSGSYYVPTAKEAEPSAFGKDPKLAAELWDWTEKELKEHGY